MSIVQALEEYHINPFEYAFLSERSHKDNDSFKFYIPKLMPYFPFSSPKHTNWVFNNNIFLNDDACKPRTSTQVQAQNYVTVGRHFNRSFGARADYENRIAANTRFIIQIMDGNIRDMRVSDVV